MISLDSTTLHTKSCHTYVALCHTYVALCHTYVALCHTHVALDSTTVHTNSSFQQFSGVFRSIQVTFEELRWLLRDWNDLCGIEMTCVISCRMELTSGKELSSLLRSPLIFSIQIELASDKLSCAACWGSELLVRNWGDFWGIGAIAPCMPWCMLLLHCSELTSAKLTCAMRWAPIAQRIHRTPHPVCCSVLQCVAVCCSVSQCVAVCCSVLQHPSPTTSTP